MRALLRLLPVVFALQLPAAAAAAEQDGADEDLSSLEEAETDELPDEAAREVARADGAPLEETDLPEQDRPRDDVEFDDFYGELSAQGTWVETEAHGWAWVPNRQGEVEGWRPYLYGQWVWSRWGWTWVSEEPFGWATYHYGRWAWSDGWGWSWVPGYTWGPAWVAWRSSDDAIGWAPLYPGYVTYSDGYPFHESHWVFVGSPFFYCHPIHRHWYHDHAVISHHYHRSHWSHHWRHVGSNRHQVYAGPTRSHVERSGSTIVRSTRIESSSRPLEQGLTSGGKPGRAPERVSVYRPERRTAVEGASRPRVSVPRSEAGSRGRPVGSGLDGSVSRPRTRSTDDAVRGRVGPDRGSIRGPARSSTGVRNGAAPDAGATVRDGTPSGGRRSGGARVPSTSGRPSYRRPGGDASRGPTIGGAPSSRGPTGLAPGKAPAAPRVSKGKKKPGKK